MAEDDLELDDAESVAPSHASLHRGHKGKLMSILAKLKRVKPVYWVLGLGGTALLVDYYVEGNRSVASSLYRGVFGGGGGGGGGGGAHHAHHAHPAAQIARPAAQMPMQQQQGMQGMQQQGGQQPYDPTLGYYAALPAPMYAPHDRMRRLYDLHRMSRHGHRDHRGRRGFFGGGWSRYG